MKKFKFLNNGPKSVKELIVRGIRNCSTFNIKFSDYDDYYIERGIEKHIKIKCCIAIGNIVEVHFDITHQKWVGNSWGRYSISHILNLRQDEFMNIIGGLCGYNRYLRRESNVEYQF